MVKPNNGHCLLPQKKYFSKDTPKVVDKCTVLYVQASMMWAYCLRRSQLPYEIGTRVMFDIVRQVSV